MGAITGITPDNRPLTALEGAMLGLWLMGMRYMAASENGDTVSAFTDKPDLVHGAEGYWWADGGHWIDLCEEGMTISTPSVVSDLAGLCPDPVALEILPWLAAHGITPPEVVK
jgi:hypothetical protein